MYKENKDLMYYIAVYNENYPMPSKPKECEEGILRGLYKLRNTPKGDGSVVRLLGSGPIMLQLLAAVEILENYGVRSEIWSATSYGELRRDGLECERTNRLNPGSERIVPYVEQQLGDGKHPTIAVSDNQIAVPDMIRQWVGGDYTILGTDGFGRSDLRSALRRHFEIDSEHIALASLSALVKAGEVDYEVYQKAVKDLEVNIERKDITEI